MDRMSRLSPILSLLMDLETAVERGESVAYALRAIRSRRQALHQTQEMGLNLWIDDLLLSWERGRPARAVSAPGDISLQLAEILDEGWRGASVLRELSDLRAYAEEQAESDLENFVQALPLRSLIPLLLFQLPSLMLVLLWPILQKLVRDLG